jgi:hypothetical protein
MKLQRSLNSPTLTILKIIGTPFAEHENLSDRELKVDGKLLRCAVSNRTHLYFLESLFRKGIDAFNQEFQHLTARYERVNRVLVRIAQALETNQVDYAFFKTIRPYREVTVDIDTIILDNRQTATRVLKDAGLELLKEGPLATTLRDQTAPINIDLYQQIGVSHLIYLDKEKLTPFIQDKTVKEGRSVKSLAPIADLLAIISHSILKEQLYLLSEYFTSLHYLHHMNGPQISRLAETAERWKLKRALSTHLSLTALIHKEAHGFTPRPLDKLLEEVDYNNREAKRVLEKDYLAPHKYHPLTVANSLLEKLSEPIARRSLATQLVKICNPTFGTSFVKEALRHSSRSRY